jgi:hypothetical protein
MQTFLERYIEPGNQQAVAAVLLPLVERKLGPPSASVRERIASADPDSSMRNNWLYCSTVLFDALAAAGAGLQMPGAQGHGEVGVEAAQGLAAAVRHHRPPDSTCRPFINCGQFWSWGLG